MTIINNGFDCATTCEYEREYVIHTWSAQKNFKPFIITRAKGCYFWDDRGKKYLDFSSHLTNVNAGHQHPKIINAIKDQSDRMCYVLPGACNDQRARLAKMLADLAPGDLCKTLFVSGGGEANENALKIARAVTGRQKVIARFNSYHGATYGASSVTGDPRHRASEPGVPGTIRVWDPFCYRCFFKMKYPECDLYCAETIREVIEIEGPETVAAIIIEPITGSCCRIVPPKGYMERLRKICDDYGILLIFDEVMTGFGRSGEWFAAYHWDVTPDIMTLSKGINSGTLPLGAMIVTKRVLDPFQNNMLYAGVTQSGNPVACASGIAAIEVYKEERMVENSKELGFYLLQKLEEIKENHPTVGDVRGKGLLAAIEFVKNKETREPLIPWTVEYFENTHPLARQLLGRLKEKGVHTYMRWNVLMICPPLCITKEELAWGLETIDQALSLIDVYIAKSS
ncbi:MAG: aminotransferase class III-fold pyridoxal phosphate-dependent enzyme [Pseudomonadota bacterium]